MLAYAPYPRQLGALGFVGAGEVVRTTAGWKTPARELVAEFGQDQKRAPTAAEIAVLKRLAKRANDILVRPNITAGHPSRTDEMDWNTAQGLINFYLVHGRGPDNHDPVAPPRGGPEIEALVNAATDSVPDKSWIKSAIHTVTAGPIKVVGDVAHVVGEAALAPIHIATAIASGERLDHVALGALKDQIKIVKDVAPYATTVVSLVPGVGTGVAAAVSAGAALAEGQSLTAAAKAAIRGAIPGGALAQSGFDLAMKVASGANVAKAALESARGTLPPAAQKAYDIGVAVATGEKLQNAIANGIASAAPAQLQAAIAAGEQAISSTPGLSAALKSVPVGDAAQGFKLAAGLLSHATVGEPAIAAARAKLSPAGQQGFDAALHTQAPHNAAAANVVAKAGPKILEPPKKTATGPIVHEPPKKAPAPSTGPIVHEPPKPSAVAVKYGPYPKMTKTGVSAPPHGPHGPHGGGGHHGHGGSRRGAPRIFRGGRGVPGWDTYEEVITTTETCRTWSDLVPIPPSMVQAVKIAIGSSGGRPTTMRGDDGALYLFTVENGGIAARRCVSFGVGGWWDDAWNDWSSEVKDLWRGA